MRTIRLIITFYKSFAFAGLAVTLACLVSIYGFQDKAINMIQAFFWFKVFTQVAIVYIINSYKAKEFYFYKNLGVSRLTLWIPTLTFDFLVFLVSLISLAKYLHEAYPGS